MSVVDCLPPESWFTEYCDCWPTSEAPKSYILFSAMACAGAVMGRKVWINQDVHTIYPLMNLLLIGPSGIGKSTAIRDMAVKNLVWPLQPELRPGILSGKLTKEAMHEDLFAQPNSIVIASELANLFSKEKYQEGMIPYVTDLLDLAPASIRTKSGGPAKIIREPAVAFLGGSTKEWLQELLPSTATAGGFLPRFFIVKEDHKFQRIANPLTALSKKDWLELEDKRIRCFRRFSAMTQFHRGDVPFEDYDAVDRYALWYQSFSPDSGVLSPFAARAGVHILRFALLVALSCARSCISAGDIESAICLFNYSLSKLQEVVIPMSAHGRLISKVMEVLGDEVLSIAQIKRGMRNFCGRRDAEEALATLIEAGEVSTTSDGLYRKVK